MKILCDVLRAARASVAQFKASGGPINWIETWWHVVSLKEQTELTI